jgi:hypothetical protein
MLLPWIERYFAVGMILKAFEISNTKVLNNFSFYFNVFSTLNSQKNWWYFLFFNKQTCGIFYIKPSVLKR